MIFVILVLHYRNKNVTKINIVDLITRFHIIFTVHFVFK
jgi:hypothetical protein